MRPNVPTPAGHALPLRRANAARGPDPVPLPAVAIAEFNDLLHDLHPDAPHVDADALAGMSRWLLSLPAEEGEALLQARLGRVAELRAFAADPDWPLEPALARRLHRLLDYVALDRDLIPDDTPRLGRLDDALLVELAWPMLADELEDWRDYCRFREENGGHPGHEQWLRARLEEGALWEQLHRVRHQPYVDYGPLEGGLRVV